jgi:S1-C subfamily serine protease
MSTLPFRFLPTAAVVSTLALATPFASFIVSSFKTDTAPVPLLSKSPFSVGGAEAAIPTREGMPTLAPLIERVTPAVVNVSVKSKAEQSNIDDENLLLLNSQLRRFFQGHGNPFEG